MDDHAYLSEHERSSHHCKRDYAEEGFLDSVVLCQLCLPDFSTRTAEARRIKHDATDSQATQFFGVVNSGSRCTALLSGTTLRSHFARITVEHTRVAATSRHSDNVVILNFPASGWSALLQSTVRADNFEPCSRQHDANIWKNCFCVVMVDPPSVPPRQPHFH